MLNHSPTSSLSLARALLYDIDALLLSIAVFFSDSICLQWATKHFNLLPVELDCNVQAEMREKWI